MPAGVRAWVGRHRSGAGAGGGFLSGAGGVKLAARTASAQREVGVVGLPTQPRWRLGPCRPSSQGRSAPRPPSH